MPRTKEEKRVADITTLILMIIAAIALIISLTRRGQAESGRVRLGGVRHGAA